MAGELEKLIIRLEADTTQLRRALNQSDAAVDKFARNAERSTGVAANSFKRMFAVIGTGVAIKKIADLADAAKNMSNRLQTVTKTTAEFTYAQKQLFDIAQDTRVSVADTTDLYARYAFALKDAGVSTNEVLKLTQTLSKAVIVSGASSAEAAGTLRQLSQGLAAGTLRGQELNSVMEQMPIVADLIAKQLGVTTGELKKMGEQGQITSKQVFDALLKGADEIDRKFAKTTPTIAQGFEQLNNSLLAFVGRADAATNASTALAVSLKAVADGINSVDFEYVPGAGGARSAVGKRQASGFALPQSGGYSGGMSRQSGRLGFDPNQKGNLATPPEDLEKLKTAWQEIHEAQMNTLDDLVGDKTETAAAKIAALTSAVKDGSITFREFGQGVRHANEEAADSQDALLSTTSQFLDTMFKDNKMAASASALINTYQAITKALATYAPPYSYAMAAMQAAMGFAQVKAINSTSKSGGGGGKSSMPSGGASSAGGGGGGGGSQGNTMTHFVRGLGMKELFTGEMVRDFVGAMLDYQRDGGKIILT